MQSRISTNLFLCVAISVTLVVLLAVAGFNVRANRWGVFADDYETFHGRARPNRHWLKTRFLTQTPHAYDCVLFGSSRVGAIDHTRLPGQCYNFWHAGGLPSNHYDALAAIIESGVQLKRVYMALDDISYFWDPADNQRHYLRRGYPLTPTDWVAGHVFYLASPIEFNSLGQALGNVPKRPQPMYVLDTAQDWQRIDDESRVLYNQPQEQDTLFRSINETLSVTMSGASYRGADAAQDVRRFVTLAREHGIEVELFFNPLHYKTYLSRDYPYITDFKQRLANIQPFYDFTGLNEYTTDNRYWKEASHYTSLVGNVMLDVLLSGDQRSDGFGRLVRPAEIEALESAQLHRDVGFVPDLLRKEGLMRIPPRFYRLMQGNGELQPSVIIKPRDVATEALMAGGEIHLSRKRSAADNRPGIWTRLQQGDLFVLRFALESRERGRLTFTMRRDESIDGEEWRSFRYILSPGLNEGHIAGFVTRARPPLRIQLTNGGVHQHWEPLELYTFSAR